MIFNQIIIKFHLEDKELIKIAEEKIREDLKNKTLGKFNQENSNSDENK